MTKHTSRDAVWNWRKDHPQDSVPDVTDVPTLEEGEVYVGVVERFSSSGNANVKLPSHMDRKFVNLGPIDEAAEGEPVRFRFLETGWGKCLTERYIYDGYNPRHGVKHSSTSSSSSSSSSSSGGNPLKGSKPGNKNDLLSGHL